MKFKYKKFFCCYISNYISRFGLPIDLSKSLTVYKLIELLRAKQSKVETDLVKLRMGEIINKK